MTKHKKEKMMLPYDRNIIEDDNRDINQNISEDIYNLLFSNIQKIISTLFFYFTFLLQMDISTLSCASYIEISSAQYTP